MYVCISFCYPRINSLCVVQLMQFTLSIDQCLPLVYTELCSAYIYMCVWNMHVTYAMHSCTCIPTCICILCTETCLFVVHVYTCSWGGHGRAMEIRTCISVLIHLQYTIYMYIYKSLIPPTRELVKYRHST